MSRLRPNTAASLALAGALLALVATAADAQVRRDRHAAVPPRSGDGYVWVTAESRWGNGTVRGPVRQGNHGRLEVRLPGGTWMECERVCSETLRTNTVDFWESHGNHAKDGGPNYLSFQWRW
jgi:hypothetical protein